MRKVQMVLLLLIMLGTIIEQSSSQTTQTILASCFNDSEGNTDNNLYDGGYYFAELGCCGGGYYGQLGAIFGYPNGLPNGFSLSITYNGNTIQATKGDVGKGGPSQPLMDIHIVALGALLGDSGQASYSQCDNFLNNVQISGQSSSGEQITFTLLI